MQLLVRSVSVDAGSVHAGLGAALVDVPVAVDAVESRCARALVSANERRALGAVLARRQSAVIERLALVSAVAAGACARVALERVQQAGALVLARRRVAHVGHRDLAQRRREAQRTRAREAGHGVRR